MDWFTKVMPLWLYLLFILFSLLGKAVFMTGDERNKRSLFSLEFYALFMFQGKEKPSY